MNRFFIRITEYGTDAAVMLPGEDKLIQVFIGQDGSRSFQVHPISHGQELTEAGLSNYSQTEASEILQLLTQEFTGVLLSLIQAMFNTPIEQSKQLVLDLTKKAMSDV